MPRVRLTSHITHAFLALVAAIVVAACTGDATGRGTKAARIDLAAMFRLANTTAVVDQVTSVHVTLTRTSPAPVTTLLDESREFTDPGRGNERDITVQFPLTDGAEYVIRVTGLNANAETIFDTGPVTFSAADIDSRGNVSIAAPLSYVGPGGDATRVTVAPASLALEFGEQATLVAQVFGAGDAATSRAPLEWTVVGNTAVASVDQTGRVTAGQAGSATIVLKVLGGSRPSVDVPVTVSAVVRTLELVSGGGQSGTPGAPLANPIVVRVRRGGGVAVAGATVTFSGGTVTPASTTTDANGLAQTAWTLNQNNGTQSLTVASPNAASLQVDATAGLSTLSLVSGGSQSGTVGSALAQPIVVSVMNGATPVAGRTVTFAAASGSGSVTPTSAVTDANGRAQTAWTLSTSLGAQTMTATASAASPSPLTINATGTITNPFVQMVSAVPSAVNPGAPVTVTARVLTSSTGVPVVGAVVTFASTGSSNVFTPATATTPANGTVTTQFTSSTSENKLLTASFSGVASTALLVQVATQNNTGTALVKISGDNQTAAYGTVFAFPLVVQVRNSFGSPVPNAFVDFGSSIGDLRRSTDASGNAQQLYNMPNDPVTYPPNVVGFTTVRLANSPSVFVQFAYTPVFPPGAPGSLWLPGITVPPIGESGTPPVAPPSPGRVKR